MIENSGQFQPTHGHTRGGMRSPEYIAWSALFARCENEKSEQFPNYGGRGIKICERWRSFENFFADMGQKPSPQHSIDRYPDNDGNYEPRNCRWATAEQQIRNRRMTHIVEFRGCRLPVIEAAALAGLPYETVRKRLKRMGWPVEKALTEPLRGSR